MTREEADFIGAMNMCDEISNEAYKKIMCHCEECDIEPCDDVVSRETVIEWLKAKDIIKMSSQEEMARKELKALPSVRPQEQTGKWEEIVKEHKCFARDDTYTTTEYICSECGAEPFTNEDGFYEFSNYCPNCGARMVDPRERSDK